ncbi:hypothetical protein [Parendozoicomonas haliclonae]|uniref:Uncharacterized protein n=1 Tax=Parendozoicomonas haliclonae TaxID=1960125 RepID=A0A1X7AQT1_9GAMM|nr:hypothetical protein [Parendozoicomonas haliclonae]SMA49767.1 hypothetical protein EHSB41UT_03556 [Parendozoicomonas haliclonae]
MNKNEINSSMAKNEDVLENENNIPAETVQIETQVDRLEELVSEAETSPKEIKRFLAEKLHEGEINTQELIDTLLYASVSHAAHSETEKH